MLIISSILLAAAIITELFAAGTNRLNLRYLSKPLLMPLLVLVYGSSAREVNGMIITALVFSFLGDSLLLGSDKKAALFSAGLGSFLAAHIAYIAAFAGSAGWLAELPAYYHIALVPYIALLILIYKKLSPSLDRMRLPVSIYAGVIVLMSYFAFARGYCVSGYAFSLPFAGSLFFMASDFLIAYNKFVRKTEGSDFSIMLLYIVAQILIVAGFI